MSTMHSKALCAAIAMLCGSVSAADYALEEVVVTAQKRAQSLNDVSIAVTAFTGDSLKQLGAARPIDIAAQTPNLNVKNSLGQGSPVFTMRGIGLNSWASNGSPTVGIYADEVFMTSNVMMGFQMFDVDRVEVLKGPQGDLFGRNTTGGAVSFSTKKPSQEFEAELSAGVGSYGNKTLEGAIGGGLTEAISARFAFSTEQQSQGYFKNRVTGNDIGEVDRYSYRLGLQYEADDINVYWNIHGGKDTSENFPYAAVGQRTDSDANGGGGCAGPIDTLQQRGCTDRQGYIDLDNDYHRGDWSQEPKIDDSAAGSVLKVDIDYDQFTLTSITAYEDMDHLIGEETDGGPFQIVEVTYSSEVQQLSQELRLTSNSDSDISWITGIFYGKDEISTLDDYNYRQRMDRQSIIRVDYDQETESKAVFGHTEWSISDEFKLTLGGRYTDEKRSFKGGSYDLDPWGTSIKPKAWSDQNGVMAYQDDSFSESAFTGKVVLDYYANEDTLVYGSLSRGFKSGGYQGTWVIADEEYVPFGKETVLAYELGLKSTLLDNTMQLNAALFVYDYTDMQLFITDPVTGAFIMANAGEAEIYGLDADLTWRPAQGLDVKVGLGLVESEITKMTTAADEDYSGNELSNAPQLSFNTLIRYEWPVADALMMSAQLDYSHQSHVYFQVDNSKLTQEDAYGLINARISLLEQDGEWDVVLWGKNLADKQYRSEALVTSGGNVFVNPGAPRTWGLSFSYRWL